MNKKELEAFAKQAAKSIKTEADLTDFRRMLTKVTVEAALNAELDEHLHVIATEYFQMQLVFWSLRVAVVILAHVADQVPGLDRDRLVEHDDAATRHGFSRAAAQ